MNNVTVEIEYCNKCGYYDKYKEIANRIKEKEPSVKIQGSEGRRGSFEVKVNGSLVHSKLNTLAYPDYDDLDDIVRDAKEGKPVTRLCKQQPITSCIVS